ncbi:MAG: cupin domain-containing protein [Roseitalea sp.]|jgi:quercetin dioxygenase-like cupin family protein|nr:cupin domain-containing protein [Roseitalea sp.]MBO6721476.1 cupin domain-containing protein [Roseitalea sp.]MBO6742033.1 cupin domain-containing protein [Roseitalea sp.]
MKFAPQRTTIAAQDILDGAPMQQEHQAVRDLKLVYPETGLDARTLCMGLVEIDPGHSSPMHRHNCEECYYVLSGEGELEIDGETHPLTEGGASLQRPNLKHKVTNTGDKPLRLLVIAGIMFVPLWPSWPTESPYEVFEGDTANA